MKITIINGQSHKGSTYNIAKMLSEKLHGDITEFFLPKDFDSFCIGCTNCFANSEKECPHYNQLEKFTVALDEADVIILASPVYVYHATGAMKVFLDHYSYRWMVHRPEEKMFSKQAIVISTAAGAGMKSTNKDMADSMFFWGVGKTYRYGVNVRATSWDKVNDKIKNKIDIQIEKLANRIKIKSSSVKPSLKTKSFFKIMRMVNKKGWNKVDSEYWKEKGWTDKVRPW